MDFEYLLKLLKVYRLRVAYSLSRAFRPMRELLRTLRPRITILEGVTKFQGLTTAVCHLGDGFAGSNTIWAEEIYSNGEVPRVLGREWLWRLRPLLRKWNCSFVTADYPKTWKPILVWFLKRYRMPLLHLPVSLHTIVDISDLETLFRSNENLKKDLKKITKNNFKCEISTKPEEFKQFIENFYEPNLRRSHGFSATVFDYKWLYTGPLAQKRSADFELVKVIHENEWISADLIRKAEQEGLLCEVAVRDGDPKYVKLDGLTAATWFALQRLRDLGYSKANLLYVRPFLKSGLLRYKRKYRPKLVPESSVGYMMMPTERSTLVEKVLLNHPLFLVRPNKVVATAFVREPSEIETAKEDLNKNHQYSGIGEFEAIVLNSIF
jgi:hypothetical protein